MTTTPTETRPAGASGTVVAGWIFTLLCPLIGFMLGLEAYGKGRRIDGRQIMMVSAVLSVLWILVGIGALSSMAR